jgi:hypothetical protein
MRITKIGSGTPRALLRCCNVADVMHAELKFPIGMARSPNYYLVMRVLLHVTTSGSHRASSSADSSGALRATE